MTQNSMYEYSMNVKFSKVEPTALSKIFPNVEDLVLSSRKFDKLDDAVTSVNCLVNEITSTLNLAALSEKYKVVSEINPQFSGKDAISKEWATSEIAKLWVYDKAAHEAKQGSAPKILAIALAQLFEIPADSSLMN